jgi:hypothetical protein
LRKSDCAQASRAACDMAVSQQDFDFGMAAVWADPEASSKPAAAAATKDRIIFMCRMISSEKPDDDRWNIPLKKKAVVSKMFACEGGFSNADKNHHRTLPHQEC